MSVKPENTFIQSIHKHLPLGVYRMKNNNPYIGGIPDCWYSGKARDLWVEYKFLQRVPVRAAVMADLSALQIQWLNNRYAEGRRVAVIIGCKEGGVILTDLQWELSQPDFKAQLKDRKALAKSIYRFTMEKQHEKSNVYSLLL